MLDISQAGVLVSYLKDRNIISAEKGIRISRLGGGVSCEVIRVDTPEKSFVVKQALPQLRVKEEWFSDVSRGNIEKDCLALYSRLVPENAPHLVFSDEENYLFGMDAAPIQAEMWKKHLLNGRIDFQIGRRVAQTLATVHNRAAGDAKVHETFASQKIFIELRIDPYLNTIAERHPRLKNFIDQEIERLLESKITLVHGDYSPKNILVWDNHFYILDFEVAHIGDPAFDLAFLTNHFLLKAIKNKQWSDAYLNLMLDSVATYLGGINFIDREELEARTVRTLALLFLARVDGKSPAEYITAECDKGLIRQISYQVIKEGLSQYKDVADLVRKSLQSGRVEEVGNEYKY